jgi:hypothetical protein
MKFRLLGIRPVDREATATLADKVTALPMSRSERVGPDGDFNAKIAPSLLATAVGFVTVARVAATRTGAPIRWQRSPRTVERGRQS